MRVEHSFLFNFSASYSQGGYKRLHEFARWFDSRGGASFAIHPNNIHLIEQFPRNRFFVIRRSHLRRLYDDWSYLDEIGQSIGRPELYYAYGIPLYRRFGVVNWSHVQNVLIVRPQDVPLSGFYRLKFRFLARRFHRGFATADVISAESNYSVRLLEDAGYRDVFVSVNGADDELATLGREPAAEPDNIATVVGTFSYKALAQSLCVFQMLQGTNPGLKLAVIGDPRHVPAEVQRHPDVILRGILPRPAVIECLRRSRVYITTTHVENSFNGASEGAFLARESFISDIPPHRELLVGESLDRICVPGITQPLLHVHRSTLKGVNLNSWNDVVLDMIARVREAQLSPADATAAGTRLPVADALNGTDASVQIEHTRS